MPAQRQPLPRPLKSCEVCRKRKTRCELPEAALDLAPSNTPLSEDLVCYRCRDFGLPCILVASSRVSHQPRRSTSDMSTRPTVDARKDDGSWMPLSDSSKRMSEQSSTSGLEVSKPSASSARTTSAGQNEVAIALIAFEPETTSPSPQRAVDSAATRSTPTQNALVYHGRPLELTKIMIKASYPNTNCLSSPSISTIAGKSVDKDVERQIAIGYGQLCTFVPHLPSLACIASPEEQNTATQTLHNLALYLASLSAPRDDPKIQLYRNDLAQRLPLLIQALILEHPRNNHAIQVFNLLSIFSPFGVLPGQQTPSSGLVVARGYIAIANDLASQARLSEGLTSSSVSSFEAWLWLSLVAADGIIQLEALVPCHPTELSKAAEMAAMLVDLRPSGTPATTRLAHLALSERLQRLQTIFVALNEISSALEYGNEILPSVTRALATATRALDILDDRYDSLIELSGETPTQGWMVNRSVRRLYEVGVVQRTAIRSLYVAAYLPVSSLDASWTFFQGFGPDHTSITKARIHEALIRATNPVDVARFFLQDPSPSSLAAQDWISKRSDGLEEILIHLAELDVLANDVPLAPWHGIMAIVLDTSNVIFETQAAHIILTRAVKRLKRDLRTSQRLYLMRCAAEKLGALENEWHPDDDADRVGKTTMAIKCSGLMLAMARTAEARIKSLQKEASNSVVPSNNAGSSRDGYLTTGRKSPINTEIGQPDTTLTSVDSSLFSALGQGRTMGPEAEIDMWAILAQALNNPDQDIPTWTNHSVDGCQPSIGFADPQTPTLPVNGYDEGQSAGNADDFPFDAFDKAT